MNIQRRRLGALVSLAIWLAAPLLQAEPAKRNRQSTTSAPRVLSVASSAAQDARSSIVVIERGGQAVALGFVLKDDGRILTARSALEKAEVVQVRYADGSRVRAQLDHSDRAWDLALLAPRGTDRSTEGLAASETTAAPTSQLAAFTASSHRLRAVPVLLRGRTTFLGQGARPDEPLELTASLGAADLGTPILDATGAVVALATRGCLVVEGGEGEACLPVPVGAPVSVIRKFLRTAPAPEPPVPWLGARVVADATPYARGVRVRAVQPKSPADEARLRGGTANEGDLVVAVDGKPVPSPEALAEAIRSRAVGDPVTLLVLGGGEFREVPVVLKAAPRASVTD